MEQHLNQKAKELIEKAQKILLVTRKHPTEDSLGSLVALGLVLEKLGKEIDLVCSGPLHSTLSFLPKHSEIASSVKKGGHFLISLDTTSAKVSQFSYDFDNDGNRLNIYITPESGMYESEHVTAIRGGSQYDLVITVDSKDLEVLGSVYEQNTKLFFETPIINVDSSLENEQYGEVNCIDVKANATTEVAYSLIQALGEQHIDEHVATSLLAGIIAKTKSFQSKKTKPRAFSTAAKLVQLGADQQQIVHNLFKSKSLSTLKLWGRVLLGASYDEQHKIVTAQVLSKDFNETGTSKEHIIGLEDELLSSVGDAEAISLFVETGAGVEVYVKFDKEAFSYKLAEKIGGDVLGSSVKILKEGQHIAEVQQSISGVLKNLLSESA